MERTCCGKNGKDKINNKDDSINNEDGDGIGYYYSSAQKAQAEERWGKDKYVNIGIKMAQSDKPFSYNYSYKHRNQAAAHNWIFDS